MMNKRELERWLCGPPSREPVPAEIARLLGVRLEDVGDTTLLRTSRRLQAVRFVLSVLRDVYSDDADVRCWIRTPHPGLAHHSALDLLMAGHVREVEDLALAEWHRQMGPPLRGSHLRRSVVGALD